MNKNLIIALVIIAAFVAGSLYFYKQYPLFQNQTAQAPEEQIDSALNQVDEVTVQTNTDEFSGSDLNSTDLGL